MRMCLKTENKAKINESFKTREKQTFFKSQTSLFPRNNYLSKMQIQIMQSKENFQNIL